MITHYEYTDPDPDLWRIEPIKLGKINLIVGASSVGKTRFLNTFFNFALTVAQGGPFRKGNWKIKAVVGNYEYEWKYSGASETPNTIQHELLTRKKTGENREILIERSEDTFRFKGEPLPKLNSSTPSVTILKEEPTIEPFHRVFSHMKFRKFDKDPYTNAVMPQILDTPILKLIESKPDLENILKLNLTIAGNLLILKNSHTPLYKFAVSFFKEYFSTVKDIKVELVHGSIPTLTVYEKGVKNPIPLDGLSSGMLKSLLIISDIISLPDGFTYLMDEYENSLGVNIIDFLPELLAEYGRDNQFLITTHHPYLINNIPMKNWLVFHRNGSTVSNKTGHDLEKEYGKSKQKAFIQLINDPFYSKVT